MNIFIIEYDGPEACARSLCDKHIVKMSLETALLLCSAHRETGSWAPYGSTHKNHPCNHWTRASLSNYRWLVKHGLALCDEYTQRYGKIHKCQEVIEWCRDHEPNIPEGELTPFALAIKKHLWEQCYVENNPVETYRNYYKLDKARFAKWKRNKPIWWENEC